MTNPNHVAPKTDTPATRLYTLGDATEDELRDASRKAALHDDLGLRSVLACAEAVIFARERQFRELESTLAAERASRKIVGICELAVDNPSLSSYMEHWEGRALKAEASLLDAKELIQRMMKEEETLRASRLQAEEAIPLKIWAQVMVKNHPEIISQIVRVIECYELSGGSVFNRDELVPSKPSASPEQAEEK